MNDINEKIIDLIRNNTNHEITNCLDIRERSIIELRFSINCKPHTLKKCGELFNLSGESIRRIEAKALRKLRKEFIILHPTQ